MTRCSALASVARAPTCAKVEMQGSRCRRTTPAARGIRTPLHIRHTGSSTCCRLWPQWQYISAGAAIPALRAADPTPHCLDRLHPRDPDPPQQPTLSMWPHLECEHGPQPWVAEPGGHPARHGTAWRRQWGRQNALSIAAKVAPQGLPARATVVPRRSQRLKPESRHRAWPSGTSAPAPPPPLLTARGASPAAPPSPQR